MCGLAFYDVVVLVFVVVVGGGGGGGGVSRRVRVGECGDTCLLDMEENKHLVDLVYMGWDFYDAAVVVVIVDD